MITIQQSSSAAGAVAYFTQGLSREDGPDLAGYYDAERAGVFGGKTAGPLGVAGREVTREAFTRLANNRHPLTGEKLTPRDKADRTAGYDFCFSAPKSVSVLYAFSRDERILACFRESVAETVARMEADVQTRVSLPGGKKAPDRTVGNLIHASFVHETARPVDGIPDPQLHVHTYVFNVVHDPVEGRFKAAQLRALHKHKGYYQAAFRLTLANNLQALGFGIERDEHAFGIAGVPKGVLEKYSRRAKKIERYVRDKNITGKEAKGKAAVFTREAKGKGRPAGDLRKTWAARLTEQERRQLRGIKLHTPDRARDAVDKRTSVDKAVGHALGHHTYYQSADDRRRVLATAMGRAIGSGASPESVERALDERPDVIRANWGGADLVTTRRAYREEQELFGEVREGLGSAEPLATLPDMTTNERTRTTTLGPDQQAAVDHVMNSKDRVVGIRGAAGVGKSVLAAEAAERIREKGKRVIALAPTGNARDVLKGQGMEADTVAAFLLSPARQQQAQGQVIWLDEAGLVPVKDMLALTRVAREQDARLVLTGDTKQHDSVQRGSAMRDAERFAGLRVVEVARVRRQGGAYKEAVEHLARGEAGKGLDRLDAMGAVREVPGREERESAVAQEYVDAVRAGEAVLVVSPTHAEGDRVSARIRERLKEAGIVGGEEHGVVRLRATHRTPSQKSDPTSFAPGQVVQFSQAAKGGFRRGARAEVLRVQDETVTVRTVDGQERPLPLGQADRFEVYRPQETNLAVGDTVRLTRHVYVEKDGKRRQLTNGTTHRVVGLTEDEILLEGDKSIPKGAGHFAHAYVSTSHSAQGSTVDRVIVCQGEDSMPATNAKQAYVSASRGRKSVTLYTHDKAELREAVVRGGERLSATEVAAKAKPVKVRKKNRAVRDWVMSRIAMARRGIETRNPFGRTDGGRLRSNTDTRVSPGSGTEGRGNEGPSGGREGLGLSHG